jgi:hypothetical protein
MEEISGLCYIRKLNISSIKARTFLTSWGTSNISRRAMFQGFDICRNKVIQAVIPATNYRFVLQHYYKMFYQILLTIEICRSQNKCHLTGNWQHVYNDKVFTDKTTELPSDFHRYAEVILQAAVLSSHQTKFTNIYFVTVNSM